MIIRNSASAKFISAEAQRRHVIPGETISLCPACKTPRVRKFEMKGPLKKWEVNPGLEEKKPRNSGHPVWKWIGLAWFVSPEALLRKDKFYEVYPSAECVNPWCRSKPGEVPITERRYYRRFGWFGIISIRIKVCLGLGVILEK